jgi:uncharacterized cofD-like protein
MPAKAIVVLGAGPGTDILLRGLKRYTDRLTALVSTFDAGRRGGTGDALAGAEDLVGASLLALGADAHTSAIMERLFAYQVSSAGDPAQRTFRHLFLSALADIMGATDLGAQAATQVLNVQGRVIPLTVGDCPLALELFDGRVLRVRSPADLAAAALRGPIRDLRLARPTAAPADALAAIRQADVIVFGASDLHFNLLAPLQLDGLRAAIAASRAAKIYVCNLVAAPGPTAAWPASRFVRRVLEALGGPGALDFVIINSATLDPALLARGPSPGVSPVKLDLDECLSLGVNIIARPVLAAGTLQHDAEKLARTILFLTGDRAQRAVARPDAVDPLPLGRTLLLGGAEL